MRASDNVFSSVLFQDRLDDPDQPGEDTARLYIKDGVVFVIDDSGGISAVGTVEEVGDLEDVNIAGETAGEYLRFDGTVWENSAIPVGDLPAHASTHQDGGSDEINVSGLQGELSDDQPPKDHGNESHDTDLVGEIGVIDAMSEKASPHDDDLLVLEDSEDSFAPKKVKWSNLPEGNGGGGGSPGGSDTHIQYNDNGSFAGSAAFRFNESTNTVLMDSGLFLQSEAHGDASNPGSHIVIGQGAVTGNTSSGNDHRHIAIGVNADTTLSNIAARNDLIAIGGNSRASQFDTMAIGADSLANSARAMAVGFGATASGQDSVAVGNSASTSTHRSTVLGASAESTSSDTVTIGQDAETTGGNNIAIGRNARALSAAQSVAIGRNALTANFASNVALGDSAEARNKSTALGAGATSTFASCVVLGKDAESDAANQLIVGDSSEPIDEIRIGVGSGRPPLISGTDDGIGIGVLTPDNSAKLEVNSTTQGFLPPRLTTTERDNITSPAAGLLIYNTTTETLNFYTGTAWTAGGGATTFLGLSDTPGSFTEHRIPFMSDSELVTHAGLVFDADNQRLGVGTDSPSLPLSVETDQSITGLHFETTGTSSTARAQIRLIRPNDQTIIGQGVVDKDFTLHYRPFLVSPSTSPSDDEDAWICVMPDGLVGIRTREPLRSLHVNDVLRLEPRGSEPSDGDLGDLYVDSGTNKLRFHDGTNWVDLN